ncbi:MAG: hypothetical protein ACHQ1G_07995 [Planctomycetota bacterium]
MLLRAGVLVAFVLATGAAAAPRARPDKTVTYAFDLTRQGDKKPTVLTLKLPEKYWQHSDHPPLFAPGTAVRKGWGAAWFVCEDYYAAICQYHVLLEIEDLGKRKLKDAAEEHNKNLEELLRSTQAELKNDPSTPKKLPKFKLGKKAADAYTVRYNLRPQAVPGNVVDQANAVLFEINGHLVTLTCEKWGIKDRFDEVVLGLGIVETAFPAPTTPFKLLDMTDGVSKFITFDSPAGFERIYRYEHGKPDAIWEQRGGGKALARLTLANAVLDGKEPEVIVKERVGNYKDHYEAVSDPREVKVGERSGLRVDYKDPSKEEEPEVRTVRKVFVKLHREVWELTFETFGEDAARVAADDKTFDKFLASVEMWRSTAE